MTNEEKQLLLQDICGRLRHGVKCRIDYDNEEDTDLGIERYCDDRIVSVCVETEEIGLYETSEYFYPEEIKPYLRPMSSMTDEEKEHLQLLHDIISDENYGDGYSPAAWDAISEFNDYCNAHHLDNRGLIGKGLALEAPEQMYD